MIKLDPRLYSSLNRLFHLSPSHFFYEVENEIDFLKSALSVSGDTAALNESDAKTFSEKLQRVIKTLKERRSSFFRHEKTPAASSEEDKPSLSSNTRDALSKSEILKKFRPGRGNPFMALIILLPEIRRETSLENLTLKDVADYLAAAGQLPEPGADFLHMVESYDGLNQGIPENLFSKIDPAKANTLEKMISLLIHSVPHLLMDGGLSKIAYQFVMKTNMPDSINYFMTAAAYDFVLNELKKYDLSKTAPADLADRLAQIREAAKEYFPGVEISLIHLLFILKSTQKISGILDEYMNEADALELFNNSKILRNLEGLYKTGRIKEPALLPHLIHLLPLLRIEMNDPGLRLKEVIAACINRGLFSKKEKKSLMRTAAIFDLHSHRAIREINEEDISSAQKLAAKLVIIRSDIRSYYRAPLSDFVEVMVLTGKFDRTDSKTKAFFNLAAAYDFVFEKIDEIYDISRSSSAEILTIISKIAEEARQSHPDEEISFLTIAEDLVFSGRVSAGTEHLLIGAAAADLSRAWKLSGGLPEVSPEPKMANSYAGKQVLAGGQNSFDTTFLDQFSKEVRPYMETAAARDFVALFERELKEDDLKTPQALIKKLESIRYTLEGYEHEALTTFVKALEIAGKIPGKATDYLRLAGAYDLWGHHLKRIEDEDLKTPEKLAQKIAALRSEIEGRENERLVTFVEALAVIGKLPGSLKPYTEAAVIYDSMLPPQHEDPEGNSTPSASGGGGSRGHGNGPVFHRPPNPASLPVEGMRYFMIPGMPPMLMGPPGLMSFMPAFGAPAVI
jgi:hypothetical protein